MFSTHKETHVVPALFAGKPLTGQDNLYVSATIDRINRLFIKVVNSSRVLKQISVNIQEINPDKEGSVEVLKSDNPISYNIIANPKLIYPSEKKIQVPGRDNRNAIDPDLIFNGDGIPWLNFGSFRGGIKLVKLKDDLGCIFTEPQ